MGCEKGKMFFWVVWLGRLRISKFSRRKIFTVLKVSKVFEVT